MSAERDAFNALELLSAAFPGESWALKSGEFYSPSKAKDGDYSRRLKQGREAHPPEPGTEVTTKPRGITAPQKIEALEQLAGKLQADRVDFAKRLPILRHRAAELEIQLRDPELINLLTIARRRRLGSDGLLRTGDRLDLTPDPWICDGLILKGCLNLLVALPKQGKTSLVVALIAAWHYGAGAFLDRPLLGPCPPVLVIGTDQGQADWGRLLQPAGLVDADGRILPPIVMLAHAGRPVHLNPEGIDLIAEQAQQMPGLLVVIDSLAACIAPLGLKEESPEVAMPVVELMEQLEPHGATVILIHHASKGRAGEGASSASRGSTALPALASQILKLGPASQNPNDHRRVLQTEGREGSPQALVIRREGAGWELLGGIEELEREQSTEKTVEALSDLQHRALRGVCDYWEDNLARVGAPQLAKLIGQGGSSPADVVLRALQALERRGLLQSVRQQRPGQGGKAYAFWPSPSALNAIARARAGDSPETQSDGSDGSVGGVAHEDPQQSDPCRIKPSDPTDPSDRKNEAPRARARERSVGRSVGSPAEQLPLVSPQRVGPVGSAAMDVLDDADDDPHWGARPVTGQEVA